MMNLVLVAYSELMTQPTQAYRRLYTSLSAGDNLEDSENH